MKTIKNWQAFNEMKSSTYKNAAKKLRDMGHETKAKRLEEHPKFLDKLENNDRNTERLNQYKTIPMFNFEFNFTGNFAGFDWGATWDLWYDGGKEGIVITPWFIMKTPDSIPEGFYPFWIENYENIGTAGPFNIEDTIYWGIPIGEEDEELTEGKRPILFNNRKDATRFINLIKGDIIELEDSHSILGNKLSWLDKEDPSEIEEFFTDLKETISSLNVKHLFRN